MTVVEILGRPLTLKSSLPPEYLQAVAQLVNEHLRQLQRAFPASTLADLAILAALNLAGDFMEIKEDYQQLQSEIEARSRHLIKLLEAHGSDTPPGP
jgi:cell division protein ZapA